MANNSFATFFGATYPTTTDVLNTAPTYGDSVNVLNGTAEPGGGGGSQPAEADVRLGTSYNDGANTGSLAVPTPAQVLSGVSTDATVGTYVVVAANNVRSGTAFGAASAESGTLDLPSINNVRLGVQFDGLTKNGNVRVPPVENVLDGYAYDTSDTLTGTLDPGAGGVVPSPDDVRLGVSVAETVGNLRVPVAANVRLGTVFDTNSATTGLAAIPAANDTRFGVAVDQTTGLARIPSPQDVQSGVAVDFSGTGSFVAPATTDVRATIGYGHANEFLGTLDVNAEANLPAVADVLNGVLYGEGNSNTGTYVTPDNDYVVNPTAYGPSSSIIGNYFIAAVPIVKLGEIYGPNNTLTGAYDPAAPDPDHALQRDVREGVVYSNGTLTGIMVEVAEVDVREGTVYDSITSQKTGSLIVPSVDDVRLSIAVDNTVGTVRVPAEQYVALGYQYDSNDSKTGTLDTTGGGTLPIYPVQDDVRNGIQYGDTGLLQYTGNYEPANPIDVRLGQEYGAQGIEYVGSFDCGAVPGSDVGWIG